MSDEIAHYTTEQGLDGILSSKKLWATHWRFLNDLSEMQHGMQIINGIFYDALKSMPQEDELRKRIEQEGAEFLQYLWFRGISPNGNDPEFFATSFSRMPDENKDDGILSQWRSYGDSGGSAIVFSLESLKKSYAYFLRKCKEHSEPSPQSNCAECQEGITHIPANVTYKQGAAQLEKEGYKECLETIRQCAPDIIKSAKLGLYNWNLEKLGAFQKSILALIFTVKHPGFHEEKEFRFACLNRIERPGGGYHFDSHYKIVMENNILRPRLEIDFQPEAIKRIIIGPQPNQDQKVVIVRHYLELYGYTNVDVVKSSIPYRKNISA